MQIVPFCLFLEKRVIHLRPEQERDRSHFIDPETQTEMEVEESQLLLDWLALNYRSFGAILEIVTDKSQEGSQFVRGFGGIGGASSFLPVHNSR